MPFDVFISQALLNWVTGAGSPTRPTARFLGFQSGSPQYSASSDAPVFRSTISMQAAVSGVSASASNASLSLSCSTTCTIFGWAIYNSTSGGSRLVYGTVTSTHSLLAGSNAAFNAGGLIITLA